MYGGLEMNKMKNVWGKLGFLENNTMIIDCLPMTINCASVNFERKECGNQFWVVIFGKFAYDNR